MKPLCQTLALLLILLCASIAGSQTHQASLRGTITDPNGAVVPGVQIKLVSEETGQTREAVSGEEGEYAFSLLAPGAYRFEVEAQGFTKRADKLDLQVGQELRHDFTLTVGTVIEAIDEYFGADSLMVEQESPAIRTVIENLQVEVLPLDGRNFYELSLLVPGAVPPAQGSAGSVRGDFAFSVNGAREDSNNFLLDGVYNVDPKLNTFAVRPPVDAIREFEIATSTYDAAFGRNPGAQVNVVLKSGSNDFHGSLYEFHRNAALDARNFFAPANESAPKYIRNQFGVSVGGPIRRDRTFFFADYEGTRSREGITRLATVPTLLEHNGDFSESPVAPVFPGAIFPFPGDSIPPEFIHPVGRAIAALYPLPNRPDPQANFVSSPTQRDDNDHFDARVDHTLNTDTTLIFRYSFGDRRFFEPFAGPTFSLVPGYGNEVPRRSQNAMVGVTHFFSARLVNDARFAFNRVASAVNQEGQGTSINRAVGLPELSSNPRDSGLSFITITGFSPLGHEGNNPQNTVTNTFQILDTASFVSGPHLFKFGADIRAVQQNGFRDVQSRGLLNFSPFAFTGVALADLLLGLPLVTGGARVDNAQHLRQHSYHFFVNDSFRWRPNVTLSAGLRYEFNSPPVDATDRANLYDPVTRSLAPVGTSGMQRGGYDSDKNNFAPRVGIAWTLGDEGNTVLRAGYGVYYDTSPLAPGEARYFNRPFFDFNLCFPLPGLPLTLRDPFPAFFPSPLPDSALAIQRDLRTPYMQHWNLNVQRQLGRNRVFELAYVGSKGTKLLS
ncbi:MAG: TonB-dependent receptor domain-containing protein, partial [Pyrinomonadaceae bacterium]